VNVTRDFAGAVVLLAGFIVYGIYARQIALFPGQEAEAFTPRTLPYAVSVIGILLCLARAAIALRRMEPAGESASGAGWLRVACFCLFMVAYSVLLVQAGFVIATILFLGAGFALLGERRPLLLGVLPVIFTAAFWFVMTRLLGLYLAPGALWMGES
jgi:putative tricarboxylic transport membrane protein